MSEATIEEMNEEMAVETVEEKPYKMRKLCADDLFPFCTIINLIGFKEFKGCFQSDEVKSLIVQMTDDKSSESIDVKSIGIPIMMDIAGIIIGNMNKCKDALYQLLSQLTAMPKDNIAMLDIDVFAGMIIDVVKKDEFKDFFKVVSKLLK